MAPPFPVDINTTSLEKALFDGRLAFWYQPKVSYVTGRVAGAEALVRWVEPDGQVIPPYAFIPLAIESGLIRTMTLEMLPGLVGDTRMFQDLVPGLVMSFNLTGRDLETDAVSRTLETELRRHGLSPGNIQAELTETSVIDRNSPSAANVFALHDLGVELAMDDFGTGYSSISVLSQWPFSVVKVDQGLVREVKTSEKSATIVRTSLHMAHQLGMASVAEGVETRDMFDFLMNAGCSEAQGYYISRPLPVSQFLAFLKKDQRWSGLPTGLLHIAQIDHLEWRRKLIDYAVTVGMARSPEMCLIHDTRHLDHTHCRFGEWYYGRGRYFAGSNAFDAIEAPHQELHQIGERLVAAVQNGEHPDGIADLIRKLTAQSAEVQELLQRLEVESLVHRSLPGARWAS